MSDFDKVIEKFDADLIEVEDEGFFDDEYEVEVFWDAKEWNDVGTDYKSDSVVWHGNAVSPIPYLDEDGNLNKEKWIAAIQREIQRGIDDEDRVSVIYVSA